MKTMVLSKRLGLRKSSLLFGISSLLLATTLTGCGGSSSDSTSAVTTTPTTPTSSPTLSIKSSLPHMVSGGSALLEAALPADIKPGETLTVTLNGTDVSSAFKSSSSNTLLGLISGLVIGDNTVSAKVGSSAATNLTLTNYPISGPITSGPQMSPFICSTGTLKLPDGTTLVATPNDPNCSAQTNVQYQYRTTAGVFKTLTDTKSIPADVKLIKNAAGVDVPYIVRVETATIDRGIAQMTILFDPTKDVEPTPLTPPKNWNKKLVYGHGTGCVGGWYHQGAAGFGYNPMNDTWLSRGYAVVNNTLNHPTNACNNVLSGEAAAMTKEYFVKRFGVPTYTISTGTSGGAIASLQLGDMFPGLLDGALIDATFPDVITIAQSGADAHLLSNYFSSTAPSSTSFTAAQKTAISGYLAEITLYANGNQMGRTDPVPGRVAPTFPGLGNYSSAVWNAAVPVSLRYSSDPSAPNFTGARPTIFDGAVNVYGRGPNPLDTTGKSTIGLRTYDNVGVQYGLSALNSGAISLSQFLDLNASVGGFDTDANPVSSRTVGDTGAILRANQSGLLLNGGGGLSAIPILDVSNIYGEDTTNYHMQWEHFSARERVLQANGNADNYVMWRGARAALSPESIAAFEKWMDAIAADKSADPQKTKVVKNKPADLVDGCTDKSTPSQFIAEKQVLGTSGTQCNILWPSGRFPRMEAGVSLASNNLKCQLKPVDLNDYKVAFNAADLSRLRSVFPSGVCDFTKPGVSFAKVVPWASFGPSKVNLVFDITK